MNEFKRTACFLAVLIASLLHYSIEDELPKADNMDGSNIGPMYNIVQNPSESVAVESTSPKDQTELLIFLKESNNANNIKENVNGYKSKDKSKLEVDGEKLVRETNKMLENKQEKDAGSKIFKFQSEDNVLNSKGVDTAMIKSHNENHDIKEIESSIDKNKANLIKNKSPKLKSKYLNILKSEWDKNAIFLSQKTNLSTILEPNKKSSTTPKRFAEKHINRFGDNYIKMFDKENDALIHRIDNWFSDMMNSVDDYRSRNETPFIIRHHRYPEVELSGFGDESYVQSWSSSSNNTDFNNRRLRRGYNRERRSASESAESSLGSADDSIGDVRYSAGNSNEDPSDSDVGFNADSDVSFDADSDVAFDADSDVAFDADSDEAFDADSAVGFDADSEVGSYENEDEVEDDFDVKLGRAITHKHHKKHKKHHKKHKKHHKHPGKNVCVIPKDLRYSDLDCMVYKDKTTCSQRCAYGAYIGEKRVKKRKLKCYHKKNRWIPEFRDCTTYIWCRIKLKYGDYKCIYNYLNKKPRCHINCKVKGKKHFTKHLCNVKGKWKPALPKCAADKPEPLAEDDAFEGRFRRSPS